MNIRDKLLEIFKLSDDERNKELNKLPAGLTVLQLHGRGKSIHHDLRRIMEDYRGGHLAGITITSQIPGTVKNEVDTINEAKKIVSNLSKYSKLYPDMKVNTNVYILGKGEKIFGSIPKEWISVVENVFPEGTSGATKYEVGVFYSPSDYIGYSYIGTDKDDYKELFLDMPAFPKKRFTLNLIKSKWENLPKDAAVWLMSIRDDEPYILSKRNQEKKWIPDYDEHSALPPWWEEKIKDKWWGLKLDKKEKWERIVKEYERLNLKQRNYLIREHYLKSKKYVLHWDLLIDTEKDYLDEWVFKDNPFEKKGIVLRKKYKEKIYNWMEWEGSIPAKNTKVKEVIIVKELPVIESIVNGNKKYLVRQQDGKTIETRPTFVEFKTNESAWIDKENYIYSNYLNYSEIPAYIKIIKKGKIDWIKDTENYSLFKLDDEYIEMKRVDLTSDMWNYEKIKK